MVVALRPSIDTPPEAVFLETRGYIRFQVVSDGPAPAWTLWDSYRKQWVVTVKEDDYVKLNNEQRTVILRHELAHIMLGHFSHLEKCQEADALVAADVAVNWWIPEPMLDSIDTALGGRCVHPKEVLTEIGLETDYYVPFPVVHDILHEQVQEQMDNNTLQQLMQNLMCGGLQGGIPKEDQTRANSISAVLAAQIKAKQEIQQAYGHAPGTGAGGVFLPRIPAPIPEWVKVVEEFARSIVRSALADKRSHTRPQQALRAMGYHVPTDKPRWSYVPDTVCLLVDTSGSMMHLLPQVLPAIDYMRQHNLTVRLIAGDVVVTVDEEIKPGMPLPPLVGGGGTEIIPLWERAERYEPRAIVAFTDGFVPAWPSGDYTSIDTLWVCESDVPYGKKVSPN